jgi:ribosomal protein S18 acetylase RimI-like enzyme
MEKNINIRRMQDGDRDEVFGMMRVFYDSPAVIHKSSDEVLVRDFEDCVGDMPFIRGFIMEFGGEVAGYAMTSLGYTTEYGGVCVWLEDLYIKPEYRRFGIASQLLDHIEKEFPDAVRFKLEVEQENEPAYACYFRGGYRLSEYGLMTKENV